jgi:hypothetical protein
MNGQPSLLRRNLKHCSSKARRLKHEASKTIVWARHRDVTSGHVFLASYPSSGNTWLRFLLFGILTGEGVVAIRSREQGTARNRIAPVRTCVHSGWRAIRTYGS